MPRPRGQRAHIDLTPLATAIAGTPKLKGDLIPPGSGGDNSFADAAASGKFSSTGFTPPSTKGSAGDQAMAGVARPPSYPQFEQPTLMQRMFNPQASYQAEHSNFESQLAQANNQERLQNEIALREHDLNAQATRNVLKRQGLQDDEIEEVVRNIANEKVNAAKLSNFTTEQNLVAAAGNPEKVQQSYLADLGKQPAVNRLTNATAAEKEATLPFIPQKEQTGIDYTKAETKGKVLANQLEEGTLPYKATQARNAALKSQMLELDPQHVYGNVPRINPESGEPYQFTGVTPEIKYIPAGKPDLGKDPVTGKTTIIKGTPAVMPQPPSLVPVNFPDSTSTTNAANGIQITHEDDQFQYGVDPATGKQLRRPKNPNQ